MCVTCELAPADWYAVEQYVAYDMSDREVQAALLAQLGNEVDADIRIQVTRLNAQNARELLFESLRSANLCTPDQAALCLGNAARDKVPLSRIFTRQIEELVRTIDLEVTRDSPAHVDARMRGSLAEQSLVAWLTGETGYPIGQERLSLGRQGSGWRAEFSGVSERLASLLAQLEHAATRLTAIEAVLAPRMAYETSYDSSAP